MSDVNYNLIALCWCNCCRTPCTENHSNSTDSCTQHDSTSRAENVRVCHRSVIGAYSCRTFPIRAGRDSHRNVPPPLFVVVVRHCLNTTHSPHLRFSAILVVRGFYVFVNVIARSIGYIFLRACLLCCGRIVVLMSLVCRLRLFCFASTQQSAGRC